MSEGQNPTAALTESTESFDPTSQDIELAHQIVRRAQNAPLADDRLSLLAAYEAVINERDLDPDQNRVCFWLLLEILKPDTQGDTLYAKFEDVLQKRGIVLEFTDDDSRPQTQHTNLNLEASVPALPAVPLRGVSTSSQQTADGQATSDLPQHHDDDDDGRDFDQYLNQPPPGYDQLMRKAIAMDDRSLKLDFFQALRDGLPQRDLRAMERTAEHMYERTLKYKALTHWYIIQQQRTHDYTAAADYHERHTRSGVFSRLFDSARVNRMHAMEEERLRGMGLYKLVIKAKERSFARRHEARLKQQCAAKIVIASRNVSLRNHVLADIIGQRQVQSGGRLLQLATSSIFTAAQEQATHHASATEYHESKLKARAMVELRRTLQEAIDRESTARDFRDFYLMKKYFSKLYHISHERKERRLELSRQYFARWRRQAVRNRDARLWELVRLCRRRYKMDLARRCLQKMHNQSKDNLRNQQAADQLQVAKANKFAHTIVVTWYNRSQEISRHDQQAAEHADEQVLRRTTMAMTDWKQRQEQLENNANQFYNVHVQDVSSRCLRIMSRKAFAIRRRQQDADAFRERHLRQVARYSFDVWRRKVAENRGEGPLVLPPATPAQRRAYQLSQLASTTPLIPPGTSFAARLRGEVKVTGEAQDDDDEDT